MEITINKKRFNVIVFGANGALAQDLLELLNYEEDCNIRAYTRMECDVSDYTDVYNTIGGSSNITNVINCTGYSDLEECEKNEETAFKMNSEAVRILSEICSESQIHLTHISTSYVFDGEGKEPYIEQSQTTPKTVFGKSKLNGELFVKGLGGKGLILRTGWLYGKHKKTELDIILNKLELGTEVEVPDGLTFSPTYSIDFANIIIQLALSFKSGIFHAGNSGHCTFYDFIVKATSYLDFNVDHIKTKEPDKLIPKYAVLSLNRLERTLPEMPRSWDEGLYQYLIETKRLYEY